MSKTWISWLLLAGITVSQALVAEITVETQTLRLQFSRNGDLIRTESCFPDCGGESSKRRILSGPKGMLVFAESNENSLVYSQTKSDGSTVLDFTNADGKLIRQWQIPDQGWLISLKTTAAGRLELMSGEAFQPPDSSGFGYLLEQSRYLFFDDGSVETLGLDEEPGISRENLGWSGFRNRFWTAMLLSDADLTLQPDTGEMVENALINIQLDTKSESLIRFYLGPVEPGALSQTAEELESLMYSGLWFWLRWICQALYFLLSAIVVVIPGWGASIMVLSVLVGLMMRPLSNIADRLQNQVHAIDARLSPILTDIKKNYKGAEQSEKILEMYKQENVHPLYSLKSLLGVFVVIPVFIGAFDMLSENIHLSGEAFLWITDLSQADSFLQLPFSIPFFGGYLNLLPFIMTGFSFIASKLHSHPDMDATQQRKQARNLVMMSLGFLVLFYTFPAGMVLYWTSNNLISVIKMIWKRRKVDNQPDNHSDNKRVQS